MAVARMDNPHLPHQHPALPETRMTTNNSNADNNTGEE